MRSVLVTIYRFVRTLHPYLHTISNVLGKVGSSFDEFYTRASSYNLESINPFPSNNFSDFSKLKEFADDNFKFDENERKLFKHFENTVGKGEIARHEQFLLFLQCFQKTYTADT